MPGFLHPAPTYPVTLDKSLDLFEPQFPKNRVGTPLSGLNVIMLMKLLYKHLSICTNVFLKYCEVNQTRNQCQDSCGPGLFCLGETDATLADGPTPILV